MVLGYVYSWIPSFSWSSNDETKINVNLAQVIPGALNSDSLRLAREKLNKTGIELIETVGPENINIPLCPGRNAPSNVIKILQGKYKPNQRMVKVITVSAETIKQTIKSLKPTKTNEVKPISSKNPTLKELDAAFSLGIGNFLSLRKKSFSKKIEESQINSIEMNEF